MSISSGCFSPSHPLRFRQVHLDFHTSPQIDGIGAQFDRDHWQETLRDAAVDSITLFAKCHHGWSYHPTEVGKVHPHLGYDLLRAQYEATKEAGIAAPIYLSAGVDNLITVDHADWRELDETGRPSGWVQGPFDAGFHTLDFHSPYLDYLCAQIEEVVRLFPDCDGIFLDIISQGPGCSKWSVAYMEQNGLDSRCSADRHECAKQALQKYYERTTASARTLRVDMPVFHNSGHIDRGRHDLFKFFSHLELESLPTGGWGYDHFPMSAKYACNLPLDFLGMTGKFHTTWGEFGGYKHPNALRYECAAMLAFGSKCSVGDQLHPDGRLDRSTYRIIGSAYREVAAKEPWCQSARQVFDIAILSSEAEHASRSKAPADEGACRILLEGHFLFGLIDRTMDFSRFKALILPDDIRIDAELKHLLDAYLQGGGRLVFSGDSGLWQDREEYAFDIGAKHEGLSPFQPPDEERLRGHDYILPIKSLSPEFLDSPQIMYERSRRLQASTGVAWGDVYDPFFNRTWKSFSSHQHSPNQVQPSGYHCAVYHHNILTFSHPVFRNYRNYGAVVQRDFVTRALRRFLDDVLTLKVEGFPSTARVTLTEQALAKRRILHLLYAPTVNRGGGVAEAGGATGTGRSIEVVEDLPPIKDVEVALRIKEPVSSICSVPEGVTSLPFSVLNGWAYFRAPEFSCHQMIEIR